MLNGTELAERLGIGRGFVQAMKKAGFKFRFGKWALEEDAVKWIEDHPDFSMSMVYPRKEREEGKVGC